jgi:hypothetical protein
VAKGRRFVNAEIYSYFHQAFRPLFVAVLDYPAGNIIIESVTCTSSDFSSKRGFSPRFLFWHFCAAILDKTAGRLYRLIFPLRTGNTFYNNVSLCRAASLTYVRNF